MACWLNGVCGGRYKKKTYLCNNLLEIGLLKCNVGESIGIHTDPITNKKQYKIQINICKPNIGGIFTCERYTLNIPFIKIYRADLSKHGVSLVSKGKRVDLIIGINL